MDAVISEHESALLRYATRILSNAHSAQDVVQEAFLRLHRHWERVAREGQVRAWLYRTTHNAAIDLIRRESRRQQLHTAQADDPAVGAAAAPEAAAASERDERLQLALRHLAQLAPAERQVLVLRLQEGLSYTEIGRVTGRSEGNVGCLLHHATRNLAKGLKQAGVI